MTNRLLCCIYKCGTVIVFCREKFFTMKIVEIDSHEHLLSQIQNLKRSFVLLYKKGSESSECALKNIKESRNQDDDFTLFLVDVSRVRDIHSRYNVTTAPSLLEFAGTEFKNIVKGCNNPSFYTTFIENIQLSIEEPGEKPQPRVTVYSTPTCTWCNTLKAYLRKHKIRFTDIDVSRDPEAAREMVRLSGQQGVPQTVINGRVIVGFDKARINEMLGING